MSHRPTSWTDFSPAFVAIVITLGLVLGMELGILGYGVPAMFITLAAAGLVQLTDDQRRRKAARIRQALLNSNIGIRQAARIMEMDPTEFERALSGERKLDVWRLEMLPIEFHRECNVLELADSGLPERLAKFLQMAPALPFINSDQRSA
jgi:hypothetical protein